MAGVIRIEIQLPDITQVFIGQPREDEEANVLWRLYRALKPQIQELERAAKLEGTRIIKEEATDERN